MMFNFALRPGDALVIRHNSTLGIIIQHTTYSWASHVSGVRSVSNDGVVTLREEHDLAGVRDVPLADYLRDPLCVRIQVRRPPASVNIPAVLKWLDENKADPYSFEDLLRIYAYEHFNLSCLDDARLDSTTQMICSEYWGRGYFAGGLDMRPEASIHTFGLLTPAHFAVSRVLPVVYDFTKEIPYATYPGVPVRPDPPG